MFEATNTADLIQHYAAVRKRLYTAPKTAPKTPVVVKTASKIDPNPKADHLKADHLSIDLVMRCACKHFGITIDDLKSVKRFKKIVYRRHVTIYVIRTLTSGEANSLQRIGGRFGGMDHTSVLHAAKKVSSMIGVDSRVDNDIEGIIAWVNDALA